jgi:HEPN domain-containing protein
MDRDEELRQWFEISQKDLEVSKYLQGNMRPTPDEVICFHCQQSVEKDLKGYLFFRNIEFDKTHDLSKLLTTCIKDNNEFANFAKQVTFISRYAVMPRYPNNIQISDDDAQSAIRFASSIKEFVLSKVTFRGQTPNVQQ